MSPAAGSGLPGMTFTTVLAQATVRDLAVAEPWYTALLGRGPDLRPMDGLLEWHLVEGSGVQVWQDAGPRRPVDGRARRDRRRRHGAAGGRGRAGARRARRRAAARGSSGSPTRTATSSCSSAT